MSTKNAMRITIDDLRQFFHDAQTYGVGRAEILLFVRTNYNGRNLTITDLAAALGLRQDDTYDLVLSLIKARRLQWSVIAGSNRMLSRVHAL